jgi:hypothetical protein
MAMAVATTVRATSPELDYPESDIEIIDVTRQDSDYEDEMVVPTYIYKKTNPQGSHGRNGEGTPNSEERRRHSIST